MGFFDVLKEPAVAWRTGMPREQYPLFTRLSLETSSYCNRSCSFCPVSSGRRPRQIGMSDELWMRIVAELSTIDDGEPYSGIAQMFLINEPTLDKQLIEKTRHLRAACPKITMYMSTNADMLKTANDVAEWLDAGFNCVNLNIYDSGQEQYDRINAMVESGLDAGMFELTENKYRRHGHRARLVAVTDMRPERLAKDVSVTDSFHRRSAEDREAGGQVALKQYCARPHRHLVVRYDGKLPLCCAIDPSDPNLEEDGLIVGDLSLPDHTLLSRWNSEVMNRYRWHLQQRDRSLPGCSTCVHRMAYPHVVRKVESPYDA